MKKRNQTIKYVALILGLVILSSVLVVTAWATTASFIDGKTILVKGHNLTPLEIKRIPSKTVTPEPSTLVLFGGGIMGMIVSFVRKTYYATKRLLDMVAGVLGLVLLSPLFLTTALLIKLTSKGPVFYKQIRVGKDGQTFWIYKFRTMRVDAEKETGPVWASENDDRYIPCAKFLRKAHIDEIPQFFNILRGDMSLVGPRPERPVFVEKFTEEINSYERRLEVKPGLTGLAQVWHSYDETMDDVKKKLKYDLLYIKKVCLFTDIRIFFRTFRVVLTGEGAR